MKQTLLYLVRHGESDFNRREVFSGQVDPGMTVIGRDQILGTKLKLKGVKFDAVYSSDLVRAVETAEILHDKPVPPNNRLSKLRERSFGSLDGQPEHLAKKQRSIWQDLPDHQAWHYKFVDDMESDHELSERYIMALEDIARANKGKTVLIASHGGAIRTTIRKLKKLSLKDLPPKSFQNGGYVILAYDKLNGLTVKAIHGIIKD